MDVRNSHRCECCTTRQGRPREGRLLGVPVKMQSDICDRCAGQQHSMGRCSKCGAPVWTCAQTAHLAKEHPDVMMMMENMRTQPPRLQAAVPLSPRFYSGSAAEPHEKQR